MRGENVRTVFKSIRSAGSYSSLWNGTDNSGNPLPSGSYFYQLKNNEMVKIKKMILLK